MSLRTQTCRRPSSRNHTNLSLSHITHVTDILRQPRRSLSMTANSLPSRRREEKSQPNFRPTTAFPGTNPNTAVSDRIGAMASLLRCDGLVAASLHIANSNTRTHNLHRVPPPYSASLYLFPQRYQDHSMLHLPAVALPVFRLPRRRTTSSGFFYSRHASREASVDLTALLPLATLLARASFTPSSSPCGGPRPWHASALAPLANPLPSPPRRPESGCASATRLRRAQQCEQREDSKCKQLHALSAENRGFFCSRGSHTARLPSSHTSFSSYGQRVLLSMVKRASLCMFKAYYYVWSKPNTTSGQSASRDDG